MSMMPFPTQLVRTGWCSPTRLVARRLMNQPSQAAGIDHQDRDYAGMFPLLTLRATGLRLFRQAANEARRLALLLFVTFTVCADVSVSRADEPIRHSFFVAGPNFTGIIGEDGSEGWNSGRPGARDGWVLENGNLLIAWGDEVKEFTRSKEVVFQYRLSASNKEIGTVEPLAEGRRLITELGPQPRLIEVDRTGKVLVEVPLQPETDNAHMQTRMARKLANGNYLVPHLLAFQVKEYSPEGKVVRVWKTDREEFGGRPAENWPFTAIRLDNGNTLVSLTHGNRVAEFGPDGNVTWTVAQADLPEHPFDDACGCQRLPNGNTVISAYHASKGIKLFEVNRNKQLVWKFEGPQRVHHFQILTTNGTPLPGRPLR